MCPAGIGSAILSVLWEDSIKPMLRRIFFFIVGVAIGIGLGTLLVGLFK